MSSKWLEIKYAGERTGLNLSSITGYIYHPGEHSSLVIYASNTIKVHNIKADKIYKAIVENIVIKEIDLDEKESCLFCGKDIVKGEMLFVENKSGINAYCKKCKELFDESGKRGSKAGKKLREKVDGGDIEIKV